MASNLLMTNGKTSLWPAKYCSRCGGCGRYSWNPMHGDTCFGCSGTGVQPLNKKIAEIRAEYVAAVREARRPLANALEVGDKVAVYNGQKESSYDPERGVLASERMSGKRPGNIEWATVKAVEIIPGTEERWGGRSNQNGVMTYSGWVKLSYEFDGAWTTVELHENNLLIRSRETDIAPYMERANAEAEKVEKRAARKAR